MDFDVLRQVAEEFIPFNKWLGVKVEHIAKGSITLSVPWRPELVGDPMRQALHGGVISALADAAGGIAVWTTFDQPTTRLSTVDLRIDYLRPGKQETLFAEGHVVRVGARLGWADMRLYHSDREADLLASGRGVYAMKVPKHPRSDE